MANAKPEVWDGILKNGKMDRSRVGKTGRYGIRYAHEGYVIDVADSMDDARRKAVRHFKSYMVEHHGDNPGSIIIESRDKSTTSVRPSKSIWIMRKGEMVQDFDWKAGWVWTKKNVARGFNATTGKLK